MAHYVYILRSRKLNRFYTGESADLDTRLAFHQNSEARKFTAKAKDRSLFLKIECGNKKQAMAVEAHIKRMKSAVYIANLEK